MTNLIRENIRNLKPYSSARDEYEDTSLIMLDANESPFGAPANRYPDPYQKELKEEISKLKDINPGNIFLGNGSDEAIDLLIRVFCEPGVDNVIIPQPTYGMYQVCADINNVKVKSVLLDDRFDIDIDAIKESIDVNTKLIFLCSPNNPTSNLLSKDRIRSLMNDFSGIVVLDEAYIDFSMDQSMLPELNQSNNLVILQTFSKAWEMAGVRLGMAFGSNEIIDIMNKVKYPYNINKLTSSFALNKLRDGKKEVCDNISIILNERDKLIQQLNQLDAVNKVYPSDSNFLLVKFNDSNKVFQDYIQVYVDSTNSLEFDQISSEEFSH
ncbi:MAG: histidinol-phosphate transaminase, partial [Marinilabiliales bacterium]